MAYGKVYGKRTRRKQRYTWMAWLRYYFIFHSQTFTASLYNVQGFKRQAPPQSYPSRKVCSWYPLNAKYVRFEPYPIRAYS